MEKWKNNNLLKMQEFEENVQDNKNFIIKEDGIIFKDENFIFETESGTYLGTKDPWKKYNVRTIKDSNADNYVVDIRINNDWDYNHSPYKHSSYVSVVWGFDTTGPKSVTQFIETLEDTKIFATKVANYLGIPFKNN